VSRVALWLLPFALAQIGGSLAGQQADTSAPRSGISLAPSVVMLSARPGQSFRQTLRLTNHTSRELSFRLEAQDVLAENGRRTFFAAGEHDGSIAATAVFSPKGVVIAPGAVAAVDVTLTMPQQSPLRGVAAIFRGQSVVGTQNGVAMTASLGSLITFNVSDRTDLEAADPQTSAQTDTRNLGVSELVTNVGDEPVVAGGAAAFLTASGTLVGKVPVEPQRLMPGERLAFGAEYPTLLAAGRYRVVLSLEYDDHLHKVLTRTVEFAVPAAGLARGDADRGPGGRR
jgi:hypothetical protein